MAQLYVGVLGPLHVEVDGVAVRLGPQLATLLSALVMEAGRTVPAARLVRLLWGEDRSDDARTTLRSHLSHLRRALGQDQRGGALVTVGSGVSVGYRLDLAPHQVDVRRFENAYDRGRRMLAAGEPDLTERGAALIGDGLALWRGPAYATVADRPFAAPEIARLRALRRSARRSRAEALSALGRYAEAVGDLVGLVGEEPYDEGLRCALALALYADQRVDEAAQVCREGLQLLRRRGIDAPQLGDLQRAILRRELPAGGSIAAAERAAAEKVAPCLLPPDPPRFVGREEELAQARRLLTDAATVLVTGTAGVGKTTFAVRLAHTVADDFPDGQLYVDLKGFDPGGSAMSASGALHAFLDAFQVPASRVPSTVPAQAGLYRSLLAGRRVLVVLDNARDADQVRPLLPGAAGCAAVVTSRDQLTSLTTVDGADPVTLGMLSIEESRELLRRRVGSSRLAAEPDAVDEIVAASARLPLALAIVAARAATNPRFPLRALADELRDTKSGLDALASGDRAADIRNVFSWSYRMLDADAARTFRLLGLHPGPDVTVPAAASLTARPSSAVRPLLAALAQAHLIAEHLPGRYVMHDLLRGYAAELAAAEPDEERAAVRRMLDHYLYTADSADRLVDPTHVPPPPLDPVRPGVHPEPMTGRRLALAWFASEHAVLLAVIHRAASIGSDEHTWRLARALECYLGNRGHWQAWLDVAAAGLRAAQRLGDRAAQARMHYSLGRVCAVLSRPETAFDYYEHALELYRGLGDLASTAQVHIGLGGLCQRLGRDYEAFNHIQRAVQLYRKSGHLAGQACALNNVGWLRAAKGDYRQALRDCQEALTLLQGTGNRSPEAATWDSLGYIHRRLGEHQEAFACYRRAIDIYRELEDRYNEADSRSSLAETYRAAGDHDTARQLWQQALDVFDELDHSDAEKVRAHLRDLDAEQ